MCIADAVNRNICSELVVLLQLTREDKRLAWWLMARWSRSSFIASHFFHLMWAVSGMMSLALVASELSCGVNVA